MNSNTVSSTITVDTATITTTAGTALSGGDVTLSCEITGAAVQPTVTWKDVSADQTVSSGVADDPWSPSTGTLLSKLTISGLTSNKDYECSFDVSGNAIKETVSANILTIAAVGVTMETGGAATVTCTISDAPSEPSNISWRDANGDSVTYTAEGFVKSSGAFNANGGGSQEAKLELDTSGIAADTTFACVFVVGGVAYEASLSVDHVTITPSDTSILAASPATVSCVLAGAATTPTVEWFDSNSVEKTTGNGYTVDPSNLNAGGLTTTLQSPSDSEDATYDCRFTFGNDVLSKTTTVDVVTVTGDNDVVISGGTATISCSLAGSQFTPTDNAWYLNNVEKPTAGDYIATLGSYNSDTDEQVMELEKSSVTQAETYRCSFTINGARIDGSAEILSLGITANDVAIAVNSNTDISCILTGAETDPTVVWRTSDGPISNGITPGQFNQGDGSETSTLSLTSVTADKVYTCEFTMNSNTVSSTITVDTVTLTPTSTTVLSGDTVTVACTITDAAVEPTVTWKDVSADQTVSSGVANDPWSPSTGTLLSKLTISGLTSTKNYECSFDVGGSAVKATATANVLTITEIGATTFTGASSMITCTVSNCQADPTQILWKNSLGNNIIHGNDGYAINNGEYDNLSKESVLTLNTDNIAADTTFICMFFVEGESLQKVVSVDHVTITPSDTSKLAASPGTVSCVLAGAATTPTVEWFDSNSVEKTTGNGYSVDPSNLNAGGLTTTLQSTSDSADATYDCRFTFGNDVLSKTTTVDVVTVTGGNDIVMSGGTATISCSLAESQTPPSDNAWYLNSVEKTSGGEYVVDLGTYNNGAETHVMTMDRSAVATAESYTCSYIINGATIVGTATTTVFTTTTASDTIKAGETATLSCGISGLVSTPTVEWQDSVGSPLASGNPYTVTPGAWNGNLGSISTELKVSDLSSDVQYKCEFTLSDGSKTSETVSVYFVSVTVSASAAMIVSGDGVTLTCRLSGSSTTPTGPSWSDGTDTLADGGTNSIIPGAYSGGSQTSSLTISSLTSDTTYTCSFTISTTTVTESATVDVLSVEVPDVVIAPGEIASVVCRVSDIATAVTIAFDGYTSGITPGTLGGDNTQISTLAVNYISKETTFTCTVTRDSFSTTASGKVSVLDLCAKGSYFNTVGDSTTCDACSIGSYTDNPNTRTCTTCPNSATTAFTGSSSHNQCLTKTADYAVVMGTGSSVILTASITTSDTVPSVAWTSSTGASLTGDLTATGFTHASTVTVASWAAQTITCTFTLTKAGEGAPATAIVEITGYLGSIVDQPTATAQSPGATYSLTCSGSLAPSGDLSVKSGWLKDGEQVDISLSATDSVGGSKVTSTLNIGYLTSSMTGNYACYFKYGPEASIDSVTHKVVSNVAFLAVKGISLLPVQSGGITGGSSTITCLGVSDADAKSIEWKINGVPVPVSSTKTITTTFSAVSASKESKSVLTVNPIIPQDQGTIECLMLFDKTWYSDEGIMNVISIVKGPSDASAFTGGAASMVCIVEGPPNPTIEWYKDSVKLSADVSSISFAPDYNEHTSALSLTEVTLANEGVYKCKAIWATDNGVTGGNSESNEAQVRVYGVSFLTQNTEVEQNEGLKIECRIDDFETAAIVWKKDGVTLTGDGISRYDANTWSDEVSATTSSIGTTKYSCAAKYTHSAGEISYSAYETTTVTVYKTCSSLSDPTAGTLLCTGSSSDKTCTVSCSDGYIGRATPTTFTCTDGTWDSTPGTTECTVKSTPSSYTLTYTAVYNYGIPCTSSWGPYILAAYPYHMNAAAASLANVPATVQMDANSFECLNDPVGCSSSSTCQKIKIQFQYIQTASLTNDDPLQTTLTEIKSYVSSTTINVITLLDSNSRLDSNGNLIGSFSGKKKRSASDEKYAGPGFVLDPPSSDGTTLETIQCPEFTITVNGLCTMCGHGWFMEDNDCSPCPLATYQREEDSNKCTPCPEGTSTLVTAATSHAMCLEVCKAKKPAYGSVHPPEDTLLTKPSYVTVLCDEGFTLNNGDQQQDVVSCEEVVHCSRVEIVDIPAYTIQDTELTITCIIESEQEFANCTLVQEEAVVQTSSVKFDNNRQICTFDINISQSTDMACGASIPGVQLTSEAVKVTMLKPAVTANTNTVRDSETVHLACSAIVPFGYSVQMHWRKHGKAIGLSSYSEDSLGLIVYSKDNAQFEDSGEYTCEVEYLGIGISESESVPITVVGFLEELSNFSLYEGQGVELRCVLPTGNLVSMLEWYRDGVRQFDSGSAVDGEMTKVISSEFTASTAGTYECRGESNGVLISSKATLISHQEYGFLTHPESQYITQGNHATFSCRFSDPTATIKWLLGGNAMKEEQNNRATLTLANLASDSTVQCLAVLSTGEELLSKAAKVIVRRFITKPSDTVLGDDDATFHCSVYGPGILNVDWKTEYGAVIPSTSVTQLTALELHATLTVGSTNKLRCIATFEEGDQLMSHWVNTLTYEVFISDNFALAGEGFVATCVIEADEAPAAIFWKVNSEVLHEENDVMFDGYQGYSETSYYFTTLNGAAIAELSCTAIFRGFSFTVSSPQRSLAPLGVTMSPSDIKIIRESAEAIEAACEFYDYPEVDVIVSWSTESLTQLEESTMYVSESIARSTIKLEAEEAGQHEILCSVKYSNYGTVISDSALVVILEPISVVAQTPSVGYGEIAEVQGRIPVLADNFDYYWSINGVIVQGQHASKEDSYIYSVLRWPIMADSTITLTVFSGGEIERRSVFVEVYGIQSMTIEGSIEIGSSADLVCTIDGYSTPVEVFWYFNSERHASSMTHESGTGQLKVIFSLVDIDPSMFGHYTCVASYSDRPSVFQRMGVVPRGACALPRIPNGGFPANFISNGKSITVTCSHSYSVPPEQGALVCKDGELLGRVPMCLPIVQVQDSATTMMIILITCACVVMTCFIVVSFILWYKKHNKVYKKEIEKAVTGSDPYPSKDFESKLPDQEAEERVSYTIHQ